MKKFKKVFPLILIIVLLLSSAVMLISLTFSEEIQQKIKDEVGKNFSSPVSIERIKIVPFKSFPRVTISLHNTVIYEDTVFGSAKLTEIERLYLAVDFFAFLRKKIQLEKLIIDNASLFVRADSNGQFNFNVLKENEDKNIDYDLKRIVVNNLKVSYQNKKHNQYLGIKFSKALAKVKTNDDIWSFDFNMKGSSDSFNIADKSFFVANSFKASLTGDIDISERRLQIASSTAQLEKIILSSAGEIAFPENTPLYMDVSFELKSVDLVNILDFVPAKYADTLSFYQFKGKLDAEGSMKGFYDKEQLPATVIAFSLKQGEVKNKESKLSVEKISFIGVFNASKENDNLKTELLIESFESKVKGKNLALKGSIKDVSNPFFSLHLQSDMNVEHYLSFYPLSMFEEISGKSNINVLAEGKLNDLLKGDYRSTSLKGSAQFNNLEMVLSDFKHLEFSKSAFHLEFIEDDRIVLKDALLRTTNNRLNLKGEVSKLLHYLSDSAAGIDISLRLSGGMLDLDEILDSENENTSKNENPFDYRLFFLKNIRAKVYCDLKHLRYDNVFYDAVRGYVVLNEGVYDISRVSMKAFNGSMSMNGLVSLNKNELITLDAILRVAKMDINKIFKELDNFDQDYITDRHLSGKISGSIELSMNFNKDLSIDEKSIFAMSDLIIDHAKLVNFKPLMDLMGFVKMKKMAEIDFDRIENTILIKDRIITIPDMDLHNNAFSISMAGTHSFDNVIDYKLRINLSDLFFRRYNQNRSDFEQSVSDDKGGMIMYARMTGDADNIRFQMDRQTVGENIQEGLNKEKEEFKQLFKRKKEQKDDISWDWDYE